ncbi:MAG: hypothetical protein M3132_10575 [Actinomycetia bacterium]|nr:hypothetical protein [Actinomycetes bacterium]
MERQNEIGTQGETQYEVLRGAHWIQARKAWTDTEHWMDGYVTERNGTFVTVCFDATIGSASGPKADGGAANTEPVKLSSPALLWELMYEVQVGSRVEINERWNVFAFVPSGSGGRRRMLSMRPITPLDVFAYGTTTGFDGESRFQIIPMADAEHIAHVVDVVNSCSTWGEVAEMADSQVYEELLGRAGYGTLDEYTQDLHIGRPIPGALDVGAARYAATDHDGFPDKDEPFDPNTIEGLQTLDYPPTPEYLQEIHLPEEIAEQYGRRNETIFNGTFLEISSEYGPAIVAEMEKSGYRCVERDDLFAADRDRLEWLERRLSSS